VEVTKMSVKNDTSGTNTMNTTNMMRTTSIMTKMMMTMISGRKNRNNNSDVSTGFAPGVPTERPGAVNVCYPGNSKPFDLPFSTCRMGGHGKSAQETNPSETPFSPFRKVAKQHNEL